MLLDLLTLSSFSTGALRMKDQKQTDQSLCLSLIHLLILLMTFAFVAGRFQASASSGAGTTTPTPTLACRTLRTRTALLTAHTLSIDRSTGPSLTRGLRKGRPSARIT